jgi:hypothetical protein
MLLARFPVGTPVQDSATHQIPVCPWHGAMKESTKAKGTWYCPAKIADGPTASCVILGRARSDTRVG